MEEALTCQIQEQLDASDFRPATAGSESDLHMRSHKSQGQAEENDPYMGLGKQESMVQELPEQSDLEVFQYQALEDPANEMGLLHIRPGEWDDVIQCDIKT